MRNCSAWWVLSVVLSGVMAACSAQDSGDEESLQKAVRPSRRDADAGAQASAGSASSDDPADASTASAATAPPSFANVYAILRASCGGGMSGCHVGNAPAMLAMADVDIAYANLVGAASSKCEGEQRVVPGDPDASVLVGSLEGTLPCVQPMPRGRDPLAPEQIAVIRAWISAGAARQ
jgi:hypothetical protein